MPDLEVVVVVDSIEELVSGVVLVVAISIINVTLS
jgi:hypothetical protein